MHIQKSVPGEVTHTYRPQTANYCVYQPIANHGVVNHASAEKPITSNQLYKQGYQAGNGYSYPSHT